MVIKAIEITGESRGISTRVRGVSWENGDRNKWVAGQVLLTPARREAHIPRLTKGRDLGPMVPRPSSIAHPSRSVGTSVYLYYDVNGTLIYVGITDRGVTRNREHNSRAEWWPFVASQEVEHFATRREAADRERELIRRYRPPFNKQHNIYYAEVRAEYLAWVAQPPAEPAALARSLGKRLPMRVIEQADFRLVMSTHIEHSAVTKLIRPLNPGEKIPIGGHSSKVYEIHHHAGLLIAHILIRTNRFPEVGSGEAAIKFECQKPPSFRLTVVHVTPRTGGTT